MGFTRKEGNVRVVLVQGILGGVGEEERGKRVNEEEERVAVGIEDCEGQNLPRREGEQWPESEPLHRRCSDGKLIFIILTTVSLTSGFIVHRCRGRAIISGDSSGRAIVAVVRRQAQAPLHQSVTLLLFFLIRDGQRSGPIFRYWQKNKRPLEQRLQF